MSIVDRTGSRRPAGAELRRGERHAGRRGGRVARLRRPPGSGFAVVKSKPRALRFSASVMPSLEVVADAEVQRQLVGHAPVVVDEHAVADDTVVGLRRAQLDERVLVGRPSMKAAMPWP